MKENQKVKPKKENEQSDGAINIENMRKKACVDEAKKKKKSK